MASIIVHAGRLTSLEIFLSKSTGNLILRGLQIISSHTVQAQHVAGVWDNFNRSPKITRNYRVFFLDTGSLLCVFRLFFILFGGKRQGPDGGLFDRHAAGARSPLVDWALVHRALVWAAGAATDLVDLVLV